MVILNVICVRQAPSIVSIETIALNLINFFCNRHAGQTDTIHMVSKDSLPSPLVLLQYQL